ncbi:OmpA family protein [Galbibacter pacificus]|uniref:OmpA family protein n=1 Tax=Galbibacter pacificus TaxID=2996052 RepID=A0ABT6FRS3_9FLAO|nr:OmpA family protein [Galbibacter pacificus]MDG3582908.1 OmpA family protein [Galbibacter pacificus]MDG3585973.1 OmpA family protein [Galbibacter pacificus]
MKIKILTGLSLIGVLFGRAQEITFKLNGGLSGISYESPVGNGSLGLGGGTGLGYTYFLNGRWGIQTGIEAQYNGNTFELDDGRQVTSDEIDDQGSAFEYRASAVSYKEEQHFYSFAVPLLLQYRGSVSSKTGFYIGLGGKVLFPTGQKIKAGAQTLSLSGYYPDLDLEINDLPVHGFGTVNDWEDDTSVSLRTSVLLSMEGGLSFRLRKNLRLYTGVYADYGLTDLQGKGPSSNLVSYSAGGIEATAANGVMSTEGTVKNSNYLSAGIQVKLGFQPGKRDVPEQGEERIVVKETVEVKEQAPVVVKEPKGGAAKRPVFTGTEIAYIEGPLVFGNIDRTDIPEPLTGRLDTIADMLNKEETAQLRITGHTCNVGNESLNKRIGMERAVAVATYLEAQGVSRDRMELLSKGESEPLLPNTSAENREKNRRVSIDVISEE